MKKLSLPPYLRRFLNTDAGLVSIELALWVPMVAVVAGVAMT
jgi:hypothetical protein